MKGKVYQHVKRYFDEQMKIFIPPVATEGKIYIVETDSIVQYITLEIFNQSGSLILIAQNDNTTFCAVRMRRADQSLSGTCKVRVACTDSTGQEFSEEFDNLRVEKM
jgi:hypothetical protein